MFTEAGAIPGLSVLEEPLAAVSSVAHLVFEALSNDSNGLIIAISYIAMIVAERAIYFVSNSGPWNEREAWVNIGSSLFVAIVEALLTGGIFFIIFQFVFFQISPFEIEVGASTVLLLFLLNDLCHYIDHRIQHRVGFFWSLHIAHHSSQEYNFLVANRGTAFQFGLLMSPIYLVIPLLGFPLALFLVVKFFGNLWGTFSHTMLVGKMGVLDRLFSTPSNHRVHHGINAAYIDKNYGQVLIIWDRLFGTYQPEGEAPVFGLLKQMQKSSVWHVQTQGLAWLVTRLKAARSLRQAVVLLWRPPEWELNADGLAAVTDPPQPTTNTVPSFTAAD
jgi:sterol desaturase/sphingolipid hydroxylase (fatty acid hydroxylase superfamily)